MSSPSRFGWGERNVFRGSHSSLFFRRAIAKIAVAFVVILGIAGAAGAQTFIDFPIGQKVPEAITGGPDGNVWFAEYTGNSIGRMTHQGVLTEFPNPNLNSTDFGIALGSDGNLWFTEVSQSKIGRITPQGVIAEFPTPGSADPFQHHAPSRIAPGPGGSLWFTERVGNVGRITTAGVITEFPVTDTNAGMNGIAEGSDGNIWFTEDAANKIGRMTPSGVVTEFPLPTPSSLPQTITAGPDGNLWFTEGSGNSIGRITPAGVITEYPIPTPAAFPTAITVGPDGNLWFSEFAPSIGRITTAGVITQFPLSLPALTLCVGIANGPDGNLWITEDNGSGDRIGRFTPPAPPPPTSNRIFMSTNGNNANDCANPLTPCLTFAGALVQVNTGGEVIAEATGGYGPLNITRAMTISGPPGVVIYSGLSVTVNAPGATVVLRGLTVDGAGALASGINVVSVGKLVVESCVIANFGIGNATQGNGIYFDGAGSLFVKDTTIQNNGLNGLLIRGGSLKASIDDCRIEGNQTGVLVDGAIATVCNTTSSGSSAVGFAVVSGGEINLENCVAANNGIGIETLTSGLVRVSSSTVTDNSTGLSDASGSLLSRGNNTVEHNGTDGTFTGSYSAK